MGVKGLRPELWAEFCGHESGERNADGRLGPGGEVAAEPDGRPGATGGGDRRSGRREDRDPIPIRRAGQSCTGKSRGAGAKVLLRFFEPPDL